MGFLPELDGLTFMDLVARFEGPPFDDLVESPWTFYQEVAFTMRARDGMRAVEFLERYVTLADTDPGRLAGALLGLSAHGRSDRHRWPLFTARLSHPHAMVVQAAIDSLALIQADECVDEVTALEDHPSAYVRAAVLRFWRRVCGSDARSRLLTGLVDDDSIVRFWALDALDDLGDPADDVVIDQSTHDSDPDVAAHAHSIKTIRALGT